MQIELFGLFGIITLLIFIFAEFGNKTILGVFASLLMLMLGIWVLYEPLTFKTAEYTGGTETILSSQTTTGGNTTTSSLNIYNITTNSTYTSPSGPTYTPLSYSGVIGTTLVLLAMFGMLHYGLRVGQDLNGRGR